MRPQIQELVDHYLDAMIDKGPPADIVRDFGLPVPSMVIALLLGVPPEDLELFQHNTSAGLDVNSTDEERAQGFIEMYAYIQELVARKERDPGDDLISRLITDYVATGQLDYNTVAVNARDHDAGRPRNHRQHDLVGNRCAARASASLRASRPNRRCRRHRQRRRGAHALSLYRACPGGPDRDRRPHPRRPADPRRGQIADEPACRELGSANSSTAQTTLDVARNARGHLAFGYGTHQCIGANLARVEMQVAFATLARRLPGLQLAVPPDELRFKEADIYGMKELPVTW